MNYYQIVFPDFMRITIKTALTLKETCELIKGSFGIKGMEPQVVYNPQHYLYIRKLIEASDRDVIVARTLSEVLV